MSPDVSLPAETPMRPGPSHEDETHLSDGQWARAAEIPEPHLSRILRSKNVGLVRVLAANPTLPSDVQSRLADHPMGSVRLWLADNPSLDVDVQEALARGLRAAGPLDREIGEMLARRPDLSTGSVKALLALDQHSILVRLAANPAVSVEGQWHLATHKDSHVRAGLAGNAAADPGILRHLTLDPLRSVRTAAAGNPALPPEHAQPLLNDRSWVVRAALAGNPALTPDLQREITRAGSPRVLAALAANPTLSATLAMTLAKNADPNVRAAAARHQELPVELQHGLAEDDEHVQFALAGNRSLAPEVQRRLARGPDEVRERLAGNTTLQPAAALLLAADECTAVRSELARTSRHMRIHLLLTADPDGGVRRRVAEATTHLPVMDVLAGDEDEWVRSALARNPALPEGLQAVLAADPEPWVRHSVKWRRDLGRRALEVLLTRLVEDPRPTYTRLSQIRARPELASAVYWTPDYLGEPIIGPLISTESGKANVQMAAARHPDRLVRIGLLANEKVKGQALQILLRDDDPFIAAHARRRIVEILAGTR